jgi:hypothetical protein
VSRVSRVEIVFAVLLPGVERLHQRWRPLSFSTRFTIASAPHLQCLAQPAMVIFLTRVRQQVQGHTQAKRSQWGHRRTPAMATIGTSG